MQQHHPNHGNLFAQIERMPHDCIWPRRYQRASLRRDAERAAEPDQHQCREQATYSDDNDRGEPPCRSRFYWRQCDQRKRQKCAHKGGVPRLPAISALSRFEPENGCPEDDNQERETCQIGAYVNVFGSVELVRTGDQKPKLQHLALCDKRKECEYRAAATKLRNRAAYIVTPGMTFGVRSQRGAVRMQIGAIEGRHLVLAPGAMLLCRTRM